MIPGLRSPVVLGRDGIIKTPVRYIAFNFAVGEGGRSDAQLYSADDPGGTFVRRRIRGDLAQWALTGQLLAYVYSSILKASDGALYLPVRHTAVGATASTPLLFKSYDGIEWNRVPHPAEAPAVGLQFLDIVEGAGFIAGLLSDGRVVLSSDGDTFIMGANTGLTTPAALAGSPTRLVAAGGGGEIKEAATPQTSWTARTSQFGTSNITGLLAGNVFLASGLGGKISTGPLANPATWTARASGTTATLFVPMYRPGRWFIVGVSHNTMVTAADDLNFSAMTSFAAANERVASWVNDDEGLTAFFGEGKVARNFSGTTWEVLTDTGLPSIPPFMTAFLG